MMRKDTNLHQNDWWWALFLVSALALQILGVYLFSFGFFPMKVTLEGHSTKQDFPLPFAEGDSVAPAPVFGRLVVMVVDALSAPLFFNNSSMLIYTKALIEHHKAVPFIAQAQAPTVTLPRIKALTSGTVPTFLDFLFNFGGQALKDDNLITQFATHGRKMVFYGDDTWLKLFPDHFYRFEGTTSFFVADTVEVDNNVTRNVWPELERDDWDVMILHYLGLDHVGHLEGPLSGMMGPKQKEMDSIVERIHKSLLAFEQNSSSDSLPTLFLLCSDHGMNEMGNHGGSSLSETSSIFIFISSLFETKHFAGGLEGVAQVDLAPTLSLLFGQPIPRNSLGSLIAPLFQGVLAPKEYLRALQINSHQLMALIKSSELFWSEAFDKPNDEETEALVDKLTKAHMYHKAWLQASQAASDEATSVLQDATSHYLEFMAGAKQKLASTISGDKDGMMIAGMALLGLVTLLGIGLISGFLWRQYNQNKLQEKEKQRLSVKKLLSVPHRFVILGTLLHIASLAGSSMVEEEHQTWYFLTTSLHLLYLWESFKGGFVLDTLAVQKSLLYLFVIFLERIERGWNQTGIKWLGGSDYGKWLMAEENVFILSFLNLVALCVPCIYGIVILERCRSLNPRLRRLSQFLYLYGMVALICYRFKLWLPILPFIVGNPLVAGTSDELWKARIVYLVVLCLLTISFIPAFVKDHYLWQRKFSDLKVIVEMWTVSLLLLLQLVHRNHNLFLFVIICAKFKCFVRALALHKRQYVMKNKYSTIEKDISLGVMAIGWMGSFSFFSLGNSNSVASIDISGAYTGLAEYNPIAVAVLTYIITFSGPFLSALFSANFLLSYFEELEIWMKGSLAITLTPRRVNNNNMHTATTTATSNTNNTHNNNNSATNTNNKPSKLAKVEGMLFVSYTRMNILMGLLWLALHSLYLIVFMLLMQHFRHHLFIWSVFSPKWVYFLFWTILEVCKYLFLSVSSIYFLYGIIRRRGHTPLYTLTQTNNIKQK